MRWLDQVLSSPGIGIQTWPYLGFPEPFQAILNDLRSGWIEQKEHPKIRSGAGQVEVTLPRGITMMFTAADMVVRFSYQAKLKEVPGALPELDIGPVRTFSELLDDAKRLTLQVMESRHFPYPLYVSRIGIVAECSFVDGELPPGPQRMLEHLESPWRTLRKCEATMLDNIREADLYRDRCHHSVNLNRDDKPGAVGFKLDWQRYWPKAIPTSKSSAGTHLEECVTSATEYFEWFGAEWSIDEPE